MQSTLRCLLHLRSPSLRRNLLSYAQIVRAPIHGLSSPRVSFSPSTVLHRRIGSFLEPDEEEEETKRKGIVSAYYDPVQGRVVTSEQRMDQVFGSSIHPLENFRREVGEEEESGRSIWVRSKQKGKEENVETPKFSSSYARRKGKSGKIKVLYGCDNCGIELSQWWGVCPKCGVGSVVERGPDMSDVNPKRGAEVSEAAVRSWLPHKAGSAVPKTLAEVNMGIAQTEWRIPLSGLFGMEVSRVLGGGIVPGSLVLVGGDPGVGKSTLLLQISANVAEELDSDKAAPVVYVSGEESIEQIANRADRMCITTDNLYLYSSTDIEDIFDKIQPLRPRALIIDSIQTVYLREVTGSAGNVSQVRECTSALLRFAKDTNIPVFLIGHVTKSGDIAGPRVLEHIVDVVLYMEGERYSSYRLLRSVKNRFGSTDELGVFEMSGMGLQAVANPSEMFLTDSNTESDILTGLAVGVMVDGSRAFAIEVQALCVAGKSNARHVNGIQESRADLIISVLQKQAGLKLQDNAIFLNVVSGIKLSETSGDLAVAAAICSSFLELPLPNDLAFIGEIGLGGELRVVPRMDKQVMAVAQLGYKRCVVPKSAEKLLAALDTDMIILGCKNLKDMIYSVFNQNMEI
ncbi:DNA repair protein RadA [Rhynchospora pubera]|uniref:DNA repair protein RadA n=1 Tax=Rhynchospora pubera TaxID=906938 RepID=A0AAV8C2T2_9POAL|nr:DNA repair protein RadA [Rhynchospora pubera]